MAEAAEPDRRPAARADVIAALRQHGVPGATAAELWRLGQDLRRRTRRRGLEHAITLNLETGLPVGALLTGTASSTDLSPHLRALRPSRRYVVLHTHPQNTSFSQYDLLTLVQHLPLETIIAVGVDGRWFILSRAQDFAISDPRAVFDDTIRERARLRLVLGAEVEVSHLANEAVAIRHNLKYDRITGTGDESTAP